MILDDIKDYHIIYTYSDEYDILYVKVDRKFNYDVTVEMDDGILCDFDNTHLPVALEIMDASKRFNVNTDSLVNIDDICFTISVTPDLIIIEGLICLCDGVIDVKEVRIRSIAINSLNFHNSVVKFIL